MTLILHVPWEICCLSPRVCMCVYVCVSLCVPRVSDVCPFSLSIRSAEDRKKIRNCVARDECFLPCLASGCFSEHVADNFFVVVFSGDADISLLPGQLEDSLERGRSFFSHLRRISFLAIEIFGLFLLD